MRSGTLATPLVVGFGAACDIASREMGADSRHVQRLADRLLAGIRARLPLTFVNGSMSHRYMGNINVSFAHVEGESLLMGMKDVAVSSGSACTSASLEPSYVLRALGVDEELAHTSVRFGLGRFTTEEEVDRAVELTARHVNKARRDPACDILLRSVCWQLINAEPSLPRSHLLPSAPRHEPAVGNGPGGHRHQGALVCRLKGIVHICVCVGGDSWV